MIDIFSLLESLKTTVVLRRRSYYWAKKHQNKLAKKDILFNDLGIIPSADAIRHMQKSLHLEANSLLRDYGEKQVILSEESCPLAYRILQGEDFQSLIEGGNDA